MRHPRARRLLATVVAAVSALAVLAGCGGSTAHERSAPTRLARLPAARILSEAIAGAKAAGSMHFETTVRAGPQAVTFTDDSGLASGRQIITTSSGERATVLVVADVGYVRADAAALAGFFGLAPAAASRLAGTWIAIRPGDPDYEQVTVGVTVASVLSQAMPAGPLVKTGLKRVDGHWVIGVRGRAPGRTGMEPGSTDTLYVAATGRPHPVGFVGKAGHSQVSGAFSRWGVAVPVAAPRNAVPLPAGPGPAGGTA